MRAITHIVVFAVFAVLTCSCGKEITERQAIEDAVMESFTALLDGRYGEYASMLAGAGERTDDYNAQMAANAEMYIEEQRRLHTNIVDVRVADVRMDDTPRRANAFVVLCYADGMNEEIVVPVRQEGYSWKVE